MNNIIERLKLVRKSAGLNQTDFASKLQLTQSHVSAMEKGIRYITDRTVTDICREFGVREEWFRDGIGPMKKESNDIFSETVADMILEDNPFYDLIKGIIETYATLDPASQQVIKQSCAELIENLQKKREEEASSQM